MVFVRLGLVNVRRNMGRSVLSVVGMALAAMILSSTLPVAEGYPARAFKVQRQFVGGDIIVYPGKYRPSRADISSGENTEWTYDRLPSDILSDLSSFHPEYFLHGFLRRSSTSTNYINADDIVKAGLNRKNYVAGMTLYQSVPSFIRKIDEKGTEQAWFSPLRSRDPVFDKDMDWDEIITAGRAFIRCDDGKPHCIVDSRRPSIRGYQQLAVGSTITVEVPAVRRDQSGNYYFDYTNRKSYDLKVVGRYTLPTRLLTWQDELGYTLSEQLYWTTPQVLVPQMTLSKIWFEASGGLPVPTTEIAIRVKNMAFLENNAADLASALPQHTVVSVPAQVQDAWSRGQPEPVFRYPEPLARPDEIRQTGAPMDLRGVVVMITYSIAALLVASNMLIALAQRRREIGILKALGARSKEIMMMVLSEVLFVSIFGATAGFVLLRSASMWTYLSNRMPVLQIGVLTLSDFFRVFATTVLFAVIFGTLPALGTLRLSPMDVFRND